MSIRDYLLIFIFEVPKGMYYIYFRYKLVVDEFDRLVSFTSNKTVLKQQLKVLTLELNR